MAKVKLKEICTKIGSGATPKGGKDAYIDEGISIIRSQNVLDFSFSYEGLAYINEEQANKLSNVVVEKDDVLLNITGDSVARACSVDESALPARVNQHVCIIRADKSKTIGSYLLYYLQVNKDRLLQLASGGATRNALTKGMIEDLELELPALDIQVKIASILDNIQNKIATNNAINKNLEAQAQALFNAWFVDFEPFGREMPSDWYKTDIYSIAKIIYGAPFKSKLFNTEKEGRPIIRIRDLKQQEFVTYTTEVHPREYVIQSGDIVVGMDGEFRPYLWGNTEALLNQRVSVFEPLNELDKAFMLYTIKPQLNKIEQTQIATTVIHIGKKDYDAFEVMLPNRKVLDEFGSITKPMLETIVNNSLENKRLTVLRDTLLPKLMCGELDVSEIDI